MPKDSSPGAIKRHGMGLQFEKVDAPDQAAIDEFVDAHFFSSRKG